MRGESALERGLFSSKERIPRHWAMDGIFPDAFELWHRDDWENRKHFVAGKGFHGTSVALADLFDPDRDVLACFADSLDYLRRISMGNFKGL